MTCNTGESNDELVKVKPLLDRIDNVSQFLESDVDPVSELTLTKGQTVGRPFMSDEALASLEKELKRRLRPDRRGQPKKQGGGNANG